MRSPKSLADNGMQPTQVQVIGTAVQIQLKNASFPDVDDVARRRAQAVQGAGGRGARQALKPDGQVDLTASLQPAGMTAQYAMSLLDAPRARRVAL